MGAALELSKVGLGVEVTSRLRVEGQAATELVTRTFLLEAWKRTLMNLVVL